MRLIYFKIAWQILFLQTCLAVQQNLHEKSYDTINEAAEEYFGTTLDEGHIYIFKEWWKPKEGNEADIARGYSHVRIVALEVVKNRKGHMEAKGKAFDVTYYKEVKDPITKRIRKANPDSADQVIDAHGWPATDLYMDPAEQNWHANLYPRGGKWVATKNANDYRLVGRDPPHLKTLQAVHDEIRSRTRRFLAREGPDSNKKRGKLWVRDVNSCTTIAQYVANCLFTQADHLGPEIISSGNLAGPGSAGFKVAPPATKPPPEENKNRKSPSTDSSSSDPLNQDVPTLHPRPLVALPSKPKTKEEELKSKKEMDEFFNPPMPLAPAGRTRPQGEPSNQQHELDPTLYNSN